MIFRIADDLNSPSVLGHSVTFGNRIRRVVGALSLHVRLNLANNAADIELGNQLKLPGTPAAYLNGRLVRTGSAELLEAIIRHELTSHAGSSPTGPAARESGPPGQGRRPRSSG